MPEPNSVPAFLTMFEPPPEKTAAQVSVERVLSETEGSEKTVKASSANITVSPKKYVNRSASASNNFSASPRSAKKRFADPPVKSSKMGTLKRLTKKYSQSCKKDNLLHLLNWKTDSWNYEKGLNGDIYDIDKILSKIVLPDEISVLDKHSIFDKNFPEVIHDNFTKSVYDFKFDLKDSVFKAPPELKSEVLTEGNTVQLWKLINEKGNTWHVCCVIWHEGEPYSFGFDGNRVPAGEEHAELAVKSPSGYLEIALLRQKLKNPNLNYGRSLKKNPKFVELLATGVLDNHMITQLTNIFTNSSNKFEISSYNSIFHGFEEIDRETKEEYKKHLQELDEAYRKWFLHLEEKSELKKKSKKPKHKAPEGYSYNATRTLPIVMEHWKFKPFQLQFIELVTSFRDYKYCRHDPDRKSNKKNCMGALDSLFQDLFSCRLFGGYIIPKLCGPKKKCFTYKGEDPSIPDANTNLESTVVRNNDGKLAEVPNSVRKIIKSKKIGQRGNNTSTHNGSRYRTTVLGRKKRKNGKKGSKSK